jgi:hypothetical protein
MPLKTFQTSWNRPSPVAKGRSHVAQTSRIVAAATIQTPFKPLPQTQKPREFTIK